MNYLLVSVSFNFLAQTICDSLPENPCQNGGECTSGASNYTCSCPSNCNGPTCDCCITHVYPRTMETITVSSPSMAYTNQTINVYQDIDANGQNWIVSYSLTVCLIKLKLRD